MVLKWVKEETVNPSLSFLTDYRCLKKENTTRTSFGSPNKGNEEKKLFLGTFISSRAHANTFVVGRRRESFPCVHKRLLPGPRLISMFLLPIPTAKHFFPVILVEEEEEEEEKHWLCNPHPLLLLLLLLPFPLSFPLFCYVACAMSSTSNKIFRLLQPPPILPRIPS